MKEDLLKEIELAPGVIAVLEGDLLKIKSSQGEVERKFRHPKINVDVAGNKVVLKINKATKREKKVLGSFKAHIINMIKGVKENHAYTLKVCSGHFPINVSILGQEIVIKNFMGESVPRKVALLPGVEVKISGNEIKVSSPDKELAGQMAASIEKSCKITKRDRRIFQDGCYIISKAGKGVS